ncbi:SMC-Scp complex subunit ScpB [Halomonas denitrificans]|nr:SMC-Scp complex subunit ScpB [Halomonas denitrificans]
MDPDKLKQYIEAALLAAGQPLTLVQLNGLFDEDEQPGHSLIRQALAALDSDLEGRAVELVEVAGGYRLQVRQKLMPVISRLWSEKPPRYSRALLETLAIIAYRQPITRGEIEEIRGVSLSANILKTLQDRDWIKVVGHRDVPGKPELLGTTKDFLDYFNLKGLGDLPTLAEIRDLDNLEPELELSDPDRPASETRSDEQENESTDAQGEPEAGSQDDSQSDAHDKREFDPEEQPDGQESDGPVDGEEEGAGQTGSESEDDGLEADVEQGDEQDAVEATDGEEDEREAEDRR